LRLQFVIEVRQNFQSVDSVGNFSSLPIQRVLNFDELIQVSFGGIQIGFGDQRVTQSEESFGIGEGGFSITTLRNNSVFKCEELLSIQLGCFQTF
jgi:hypothetical protein